MPYSMLSSSKNERTGRQNRRNNTKGINNTGLDNVGIFFRLFSPPADGSRPGSAAN
jgi:hypothetical protein